MITPPVGYSDQGGLRRDDQRVAIAYEFEQFGEAAHLRNDVMLVALFPLRVGDSFESDW